MLPRALLLWMTCCVAPFWSSAAFTQPYPSRPVTLVVPYAAGSGVDILARVLTAKLGQRLGQPIIVRPSREREVPSARTLSPSRSQTATP